jgi:Zn-dependent peptidase ImmA (M78 family)/DNA-binding XRE family transcriptional regulator
MSDKENIFGGRLASARKMAGMTLQELADKTGNYITKQALHRYETGVMLPGSDVIIHLSNVLDVSPDYFFSQPTVTVHDVEFRKRSSKVSKTELIAIEEKLRDKLSKYIELEDTLQLSEPSQYFEYKSIIATSEDAESAANELREQWNLGYDPIPDVVKMLEDKGYHVIEIEASEDFDGLKCIADGKKVIALRKLDEKDDTVRRRFTALHELAHHALRFAPQLKEKEIEKLCHEFACAVLYPADMARSNLDKTRFHFYQNELILIKVRWGISFPAVFSRALRLGVINESFYKRLHIGYKKRGYHERNKEPGYFASNERPDRFERLLYMALSKEVITINEAAYFKGQSVSTFRKQLTAIV